MAQGYDGLPAYYIEDSNPMTPNLGLSLKGMDAILAENMVLIDTAVGSGSSSVFINSAPVSNPNFNDTTPAAPVGMVNVLWQYDISGNVSAYVTPSEGATFQANGTDLSAQDPINFKSGTGIAVSNPANGDVQFAINFAVAQTKTAVASNWLRSYDATTGLFTASQPAFTDISGTASVAQIPNLPASIITSGQLALARGGTASDLSATGGTSQVLKQTSVGGAITVAQLAFTDISGAASVAQIPNLPASIITSGQLALARGGTASDLSATGGTSFVLRQSSIGAVITVSQLNYTDITGTTPTPPSGAVLWSALGSATGSLTLTNADNATTFNQTSAVVWAWVNTVASTSAGVTTASPIMRLGGRVFSAGVDTAHTWSLQNLSNPSTSLNFVPTTAAENSSSTVTLTFAAHTFLIGMWITISGCSGNFAYLNAISARVASVTGTTITFQDPTLHGTQGATSPGASAIVTQISIQQLTFTPSGSAGTSRLMFPLTGFANSNDGNGGFAFTGQSDFSGFGSMSASGGLAVYTTAGGASLSWLGLYSRQVAGSAFIPQIGNFEYGDSSAGNSTFGMVATGTNYAIALQGNNTTNVTNPAIVLSAHTSVSGLSATSGNQIGVGVGYGKGHSTGISFKPTSGTATFQSLVNKYTINQTGGANGAVTGLLVNAVETAVGGTHLLLDLQAGTTGGTSQFAINNTGVVTKYAAATLVSQGMPSEIVTVDLTAQAAAIAATTLISAPATGMYRISWSATITTAGTTSVLGGTNGFQVVYTSPTDSVVKTTVPGLSVTSAANTTATAVGGSIIVYAKSATNIQYSYDYTSTGTAMNYELHIKVERL